MDATLHRHSIPPLNTVGTFVDNGVWWGWWIAVLSVTRALKSVACTLAWLQKMVFCTFVLSVSAIGLQKAAKHRDQA